MSGRDVIIAACVAGVGVIAWFGYDERNKIILELQELQYELSATKSENKNQNKILKIEIERLVEKNKSKADAEYTSLKNLVVYNKNYSEMVKSNFEKFIVEQESFKRLNSDRLADVEKFSDDIDKSIIVLKNSVSKIEDLLRPIGAIEKVDRGLVIVPAN